MPPPPEAPPQTDHNLAEMAQQLEAALRRAPAPESRPPVTDPLVALPAKPAPPRDLKPRLEPKFESPREAKIDTKFEPKFEPKFESKFEPKLDTRIEPPAEFKPEPKPTPAPVKAPLDNLEEEMANLLGRPSGKT